MKPINLISIALFILFAFVSCNNEGNGKLQESYINIEDKGVYNDVSLSLFYYPDASSTTGKEHYMTFMCGATHDSDFFNMTVAPNDIVMLSVMDFFTPEIKSIPTGVYPITYDGKNEPVKKANAIGYAALVYVPKGVNPYDEDNIEEYDLIGGELQVTKNGDEYTLKLTSTLNNGKIIRAFYQGQIMIK